MSNSSSFPPRPRNLAPAAPAAAKAEFPPVDAALLAALETVFPDRCPDGGMSDAEIRERIGETRVVRFLKLQAERQRRAGVDRVL